MKTTNEDRSFGCLERLERNKEDFIVPCLHCYDCGWESVYFAVYSPDRKDLVREHLAQIEAAVEKYHPSSGHSKYLSGAFIRWISNKSPVYTKEDGKQCVATFEAIAGVGCQWKELMGAVQLQELSTPGLTDAEQLAIYHKEYHREASLEDEPYHNLDKSYWDVFPKGSLPEFVEKTLNEQHVASHLSYFELPFNPESVPQDCLDYVAELGKYMEDQDGYIEEREAAVCENGETKEKDNPFAYASIPSPWSIVKRTRVLGLGKDEFYKKYGGNPFPSLADAFS